MRTGAQELERNKSKVSKQNTSWWHAWLPVYFTQCLAQHVMHAPATRLLWAFVMICLRACVGNEHVPAMSTFGCAGCPSSSSHLCGSMGCRGQRARSFVAARRLPGFALGSVLELPSGVDFPVRRRRNPNQHATRKLRPQQLVGMVLALLSGRLSRMRRYDSQL